MITATSKLALLMHGYTASRHAKMGFGLLRYGVSPVFAVVDRDCAGQSISDVAGLSSNAPIVASVARAAALGADTLVIAIATSGGVLPPGYREEILVGLRSGMSLVNGLHGKYAEDVEFAAALQPGRFIWDLRTEPRGLGSGRGRANDLSCRRVLTVGTDMAIGKMTASLELHRSALATGLRSVFLATGQIGIAISGDGVALDAVRVDFATGAIESLCLRHPDVDVQWVEGQGSILHPGSSAWLGIMRGAQPTHLVLVHRAGQQRIDTLEEFPIPPLREVIAGYEAIAGANPGFSQPKVVAIALNCGHLRGDHQAERQACEEVEAQTGLPTDDVVRNGASRLLNAVMS